MLPVRWTHTLLLLSACSSHANPELPALPISALPWLDVPADATLAGTVRDTRGAAISGAHVCAWHDSPAQLREHARGPRCTTSDNRGAFELTALVPAPYHVHASAPTFQPAAAPAPISVPAGQRRDVDLTLTPGGAPLHGHIVDHHGVPISGAWVTNFSLAYPAYERGAAAAVQTQADGRFTLWLKPGLQRLLVEAPGFIRADVSHSTALPPVRIHLGPESVVTGTVIDRATRAPVAGARVRVAPIQRFWPDTTTTVYTDAAGRFRVTRLPPGNFTVRAETGNRQGDGDRELVLGLGETFVLQTIALSSLPSVHARVSDCAGGHIDLREYGRETIAVDGQVFIPAIEPGELEFEVQCLGRRQSTIPTLHVADAPVTDVTWQPGEPVEQPAYALATDDLGTIRGVVVDASGDPVPRADLTLHVRDEHQGNATATLGGAFALHDISPGEYTVTATSPSSEPARTTSDPILVAAGSVSEVRLSLPTITSSIRGQVVRDGVPLADAIVASRLLDTGDSPLPPRLWNIHDTLTITDELGQFALVHPAASSIHSLWAYPLGGGVALLERAGAGTTVTLEISRPATLAGTLGGATPTRFAVGVAGPGGGELLAHRRFQRTDGRWGFEDLPPGTHDLLLLSRAGCAEAKVTVGPGERREDLTLTPTTPGGLRGRIVDATNRGLVGGVEIHATHADSRLHPLESDLGWLTTTSDAEGRFELLGLCPGAVTISAGTPSLAASDHLTIASGEIRELSLALEQLPRPELFD